MYAPATPSYGLCPLNPVTQGPLPRRDLDEILARTESLWSSLQGGRVFLTGGTGFFGTWLAEAFAHAQNRLGFGGELWMLCRNPAEWAARFPHLATHPAIHVHPGDLTSFSPPTGAFHGLIHAATATESPLAQFRNMVDGADRMLNFAENTGATRLLLTSSGAVYGPPPRTGQPIPEDYPVGPRPEDPATAYGQAKRASEFLFAAFAREKGAEAVLARCFAFVGPYLNLDANYAIGNFIRDALRGEAIRVQGDGTPMRSYLYAGDLAVWLWTLYFKGPSSRPIHVGSDQPIAIGKLASKVADLIKPSVPVTVAERPLEGQMPPFYVPSIARAREELGLEPWTSLEEAIRRTAAWHQR